MPKSSSNGQTAMDSETNRVLSAALQECRARALVAFAGEFITILQSQNYTFGDFLDALAEWAASKPQYREAVQHLEKAADEAQS